MVAHEREPREILLGPTIASANGAKDFAFDLGLGLRGGPSLEGCGCSAEFGICHGYKR